MNDVSLRRNLADKNMLIFEDGTHEVEVGMINGRTRTVDEISLQLYIIELSHKEMLLINHTYNVSSFIETYFMICLVIGALIFGWFVLLGESQRESIIETYNEMLQGHKPLIKLGGKNTESFREMGFSELK